MPALLQVEDLRVSFRARQRGFSNRNKTRMKAVDGVSFHIDRGETLGLVGESGCGKSTTARALVRLVEPSAGRITFDGTDVMQFQKKELRSLRRRMTMVFQNPLGSLNPRQTAGETIAEPLRAHGLFTERKSRVDRIIELLEMVGLAASHTTSYPHELSGGQQQRVGVARALACEPELIICDEPIASLDVSIQAQILNLLKRLQDELGVAYLFIAHDLSAVRHLSDRIAVMYLGRIVEYGDHLTLTEGGAKHPYTEALLSAIPIPNPRQERLRQRIVLSGDLPSPLSPPSGCNFSTRCPYVHDECHEIDPQLREIKDNQSVACHLYTEVGKHWTREAPNMPKEASG